MIAQVLKRFGLSLVLVGAVLCPGQAVAVPIAYNDPPLSPGVPRPGVNTQDPSNQNNPVGAEYFRFYATAGSAVTVFGDRLAGHYDMSFWIFSGSFADTTAFGTSFDDGDPGFIAFGDDEDAPNIAGPFGDPRSKFVAPITDFYTVAVTNFISTAGPPNPFLLTAEGITAVPEPGSLVLLSAGLIGLHLLRRRRKAA